MVYLTLDANGVMLLLALLAYLKR